MGAACEQLLAIDLSIHGLPLASPPPSTKRHSGVVPFCCNEGTTDVDVAMLTVVGRFLEKQRPVLAKPLHVHGSEAGLMDGYALCTKVAAKRSSNGTNDAHFTLAMAHWIYAAAYN